MKEKNKTKKSPGRLCPGQLAPALFLSLAAGFMLGIFAPMEIYLNNPAEFWYDAWFLLPWCLLFFAAVFVGGTAAACLALLCGEKAYRVFLAIYFAVFAGLYVQGNYLVTGLPALDGTEIDFGSYTGEAVKSAVVWGVVLVLTAVLAVKLKSGNFKKLVKWASLFVFLMLFSTFVVLFIGNEGYEKKDYLTCVKDNQFEMSTDQNFVILVLDAIDAGRFGQVWEEHPEYEEAFADFTYYEDTMAGYPCTDCAMPLLLSGEWYENGEPYEDYVQRVYGESAFFSELENRGYELSVYDVDLQLDESRIGDRYKSMIHTELRVSEPFLFAKRQIKMVGFKYAPWVLKSYCWFDAHRLWNQRVIDVDSELFLWEDSVFYNDLKEDEVTYTDARQFKMIHLEGAHVPFAYNEQVEVIDDADYTSCIEASMTLTMAYLDKLKEAGVYDNSVIVIASDHGLAADPDVMTGRQHSILFVKGLDEQHAYQVSRAPVSQADFVSAYGRLLEGESSDAVFDWQEGDERERRYLFYHVVNREHMEEYLQTGHASDLSTLKATGRVYDYE